jgi:hypothetical protein
MNTQPPYCRITMSLLTAFLLIHVAALTIPVTAQNTLTGAFEGIVSNSQTGDVIEGTDVQIVNQSLALTPLYVIVEVDFGNDPGYCFGF